MLRIIYTILRWKVEGQLMYSARIAKEDSKIGYFKDMIKPIIEEFSQKQAGYELTIKSYAILMIW